MAETKERSYLLASPSGLTVPRMRKPYKLLCCVTVLAAISFVLAIVRSVVVTQNSVYTDGFFPISVVPHYVRAGAAITPSTADAYNFGFWVFATDALDLTLPIVALVLLTWIQPIGTGFLVGSVFLFLIQAAKAVYFTLYCFSFFVKCSSHAMCIGRDISIVDVNSPSGSFQLQTYFSYAFLFITIVFFFVPGVYSSAQKRRPRTDYAYETSDKRIDGSSASELVAQPKTRRR
jgi:hypothetical protein